MLAWKEVCTLIRPQTSRLNSSIHLRDTIHSTPFYFIAVHDKVKRYQYSNGLRMKAVPRHLIILTHCRKVIAEWSGEKQQEPRFGTLVSRAPPHTL